MNKLLVSAVCTCLLFAAAPSASAQSDVSSFRDAITNGVLRGLYIATPVIQAVDGYSTLKVIQLGGKELNPVMSPMVSNPGLFAITRGAIAVGEVYLAHRVAQHNRLLAIGTLAGLNVASLLFAAHNFRVASAMQAQVGLRR